MLVTTLRAQLHAAAYSFNITLAAYSASLHRVESLADLSSCRGACCVGRAGRNLRLNFPSSRYLARYLWNGKAGTVLVIFAVARGGCNWGPIAATACPHPGRANVDWQIVARDPGGAPALAGPVPQHAHAYADCSLHICMRAVLAAWWHTGGNPRPSSSGHAHRPACVGVDDIDHSPPAWEHGGPLACTLFQRKLCSIKL